MFNRKWQQILAGSISVAVLVGWSIYWVLQIQSVLDLLEMAYG